MKLSSKITFVAIGAVLLTAISAALTVRWLSKRNRIDAIHAEMAVVLAQAATVAAKMDRMHRNEAFDLESLLARARTESGDRPLRETYRQSAFYDTIPIVAAWSAAEASAEEQGFTFLTPSRPGLKPRNPKNEATPDLEPAFAAFAAGEREFFQYDDDTGEILFARPVHLQPSCLQCHGDPASSPSGNGLDALGFPMENMREGDLKGAFVLKARMAGDPVVATTMKSMAGVTGLVIVVVVGGLLYFNRRYINRPLEQAINEIELTTEQTTVAAEQVASTSRSLAEGANQQAASLEETGASLEEISGVTRQTAESARAASAATSRTRASADAGVERMQAMETAMKDIQRASEAITKILATIDDIAFQTNILALNAAVEAARAGSAGAGFAVVADEVRALAQRSATAAKETAAKIEECVQRSQHGVRLSAEVAEQLATIQDHIRKLDTVVTDIARASQEQTLGIEQVNTAMNQVDRVTQQSAAAAEEGAAAAAELHEQAGRTIQTVSALKQLVQGGALPPATAGLREPVASSANDTFTRQANATAAAPARPAAKRAARTPGVSSPLEPSRN